MILSEFLFNRPEPKKQSNDGILIGAGAIGGAAYGANKGLDLANKELGSAKGKKTIRAAYRQTRKSLGKQAAKRSVQGAAAIGRGMGMAVGAAKPAAIGAGIGLGAYGIKKGINAIGNKIQTNRKQKRK